MKYLAAGWLGLVVGMVIREAMEGADEAIGTLVVVAILLTLGCIVYLVVV